MTDAEELNTFATEHKILNDRQICHQYYAFELFIFDTDMCAGFVSLTKYAMKTKTIFFFE